MDKLHSRIVGALCVIGSVFAVFPAKADGYFPSYAPRLTPTEWSGLYVGIQGGYGWGRFDGPLSYDDASLFPALAFDYSDRKMDANSWLGGFEVGFNQQFGVLVAGMEADFSWTDMGAHGTFIPYPVQGPDPAWNIGVKLDRFATLRGRLGYLAMRDLLLYGTGGVAWGHVEANNAVTYSLTPCNGGPCATGSDNVDHFGWTAGGGAEWKLTRNWSLKGEYLFVDLGREDYAFVGTTLPPLAPAIYATDHYHADLEIQTVRVGLNYQFYSDREPPPPLK